MWSYVKENMNITFLYSSNFSFDLPLYILDGVKQVVPLCTITLGLYVPIWQTPLSAAALKPTSRLRFTLELQSEKYWKLSKLAKCGKTHQVVMLLAEAPEISCVKDNFLKYIFIWDGEFWRSPHEHAWNSLTRGNPSPPHLTQHGILKGNFPPVSLPNS